MPSNEFFKAKICYTAQPSCSVAAKSLGLLQGGNEFNVLVGIQLL